MIVNGDPEWDFWLLNSRPGTWDVEVLVRCHVWKCVQALKMGFWV